MRQRIAIVASACLAIAAVEVAFAPDAQAIVRQCKYTVVMESPGATLTIGHFNSAGRFKLDSGWPFSLDVDHLFARLAARKAAHACLIAARNSLTPPPVCSERQNMGRNIDGYKVYGRVRNWPFISLPRTATALACQFAAQQFTSVRIFVIRDDDSPRICNLDGRSMFLWLDPAANCKPDGRPLPPLAAIPHRDTSSIRALLVLPPELAVTKEAGQETCLPGQPCAFKVTIKNIGGSAYTGPLVIADQITPADEQLVSSSPAGWACLKSNKGYTCSHPQTELAPGASISLSLVFQSGGTARGTIENCAWLSWTRLEINRQQVTAVQSGLKAKGYEIGVKSGTLDVRTQDAIRDFQAKSGLKPTGQVSPALMRVLFNGWGVADADASNDRACAISSIEHITPPETLPSNPEVGSPACTGGRYLQAGTGKCLCPDNRPNWTGEQCAETVVVPQPQPTTTVPLTATCPAGWQRYSDIRNIPEGWHRRYIDTGDTTIICARQPPPPRLCPKGWQRFGAFNSIPKGWQRRQIGKGTGAIICGKQPAVTQQCASGWKRYNDIRNIPTGWQRRYVNTGGTTIICARPTPVAVGCGKGWQRFATWNRVPKDWQRRQIGKGRNAVICGKRRPVKARCMPGWQRFNDIRDLPKGWQRQYVDRGQQTIICGRPTPVAKRCAKGWQRFATWNSIPKGWQRRRTGTGQNVLICGRKRAASLQCPKGWKRFNAIKNVPRGWQKNYTVVGQRNIICARKTVVSRFCPKGWQRFAAANKVPKGWQRRQIGKGRNAIICGRQNMVSISCPKGWKRFKNIRSIPNGWNRRYVTKGQASIICGRRAKTLRRCPTGQVLRGGRCIIVKKKPPPPATNTPRKKVKRKPVPAITTVPSLRIKRCPKGYRRLLNTCVRN